MKKKLNMKILSAILAFVTFLSCCPMISLASGDFAITHENKAITRISVDKHEKLEVTAESIPEGTYQWQIKVPGADFWVDIHGQTGATLGLSYALVGSLLDGDTATVRCAAVSGSEEIAYSTQLRVTITDKPEEKIEKSSFVPVIIGPAEVATEEPTEIATEAPTEAATEAPTEVATEAPAEVATEAPAEVATEAPAEVATEAPAEVATEVPTEAAAEAPTEVPAEPAAEASTEAPVEIPTAAPTEVFTEAATEVATQPATEAATEVAVEKPTETQRIMMFAARSTAATEATDLEMVKITVEFLRKDGDENKTVFKAYEAELTKGTPFNASVPVPDFTGYEATCADAIIETLDGKKTMNLNYTSVTADVYIVVWYEPVNVQYKVRYYKQAVYSDIYEEDIAEAETKEGPTGSYPTGIDKEIPGFTKLYNQPEVIAADGSTVFQLYYDRNYYLYNFVLDGGYGVDPVYARHGAMLTIPDPVRAGWTFVGWDLKTEDGYDNVADPLHSHIGIGNQTYKAIWTQADTTFSVIYWIQNADDDGYSHAHSVEGVPGRTGDIVNYRNLGIYRDPNTGTILDINLPASHALYNYSEFDAQATWNDSDKDEQGNLIDYDPGEGEDYGVQLQGDGSTVINVYFKRKEYTLQFVYARKHNTTGDIHIATNTVDSNNYNAYTYKNGAEGNPSGREITHDQLWNEKVKELPEIIGDDVTTGTFPSGDYTYYYFTLTARYREDIADKWPKTFDNTGTGDLGAVTNTENISFKCVGWCANYQSKFADNNFMRSAVVTGVYETLDDQILMDPDKTIEETHILLAHWSKNEYLWEYRFYVGITEEEFQEECNGDYTNTIENPFINAASHPYWYRFKLVDSQITYSFSNDKDYQPRATIPGIRYTARGEKTEDVNGDGVMDKVIIYYYYRYEHSLIFSNYGEELLVYETPFEKPTTAGDYSWKFQEVNGVKGEYQSAEGVWNLYESAYAVDYGISLNKHVTEANMKIQTAYPSALEPDAYEFAGWYTGPDGTGDKVVFDSTQATNYVDETAHIWYNPTMPDVDLILFSYWKPKNHVVDIYIDLASADSDDGAVQILKLTTDAVHGLPMSSSDWQLMEEFRKTHQPEGATFVGWFYRDSEDKIVAFDPESMAVSEGIKLFAQWKTDVPVDFTVEYYYMDKGIKTFLGESTKGKAYATSTRTFYPKAFDGYFPKKASTSLVIDMDPANNVARFEYEKVESVQYTVKCWDVTNKKWLDEKTYTTSTAVLDISAPYIEGYVATVGYDRLYLKADGENILVFDYTENITDASYVIKHVLEDVDSDSYTEIYSIEDGIKEKGVSISVTPLTLTGFKYEYNKTTVFSDTTNLTSSQHRNPNGFTIKLPDKGMEVTLYYSRKTYQYTIEYVDDITKESLIKLEPQTAKYGATIKHTPPQNPTYSGIPYTLIEGEADKSFTVDANNDQVFKYYYEGPWTTSYYIAITPGSGTPGGICSPSNEIVKGPYKGSTAIANIGFYFDGWYTDAEGKNPVTDTHGSVEGTKFTPKTGTEDQYRALFKPYTLTIHQTGMKNATDSAIYEVIKGTNEVITRVMLTGNSSVTIQQILPGTYAVREVSGDWTWTYEDPDADPVSCQVTVDEDQDNIVSFNYSGSYIGSCWLHGENRN